MTLTKEDGIPSLSRHVPSLQLLAGHLIAPAKRPELGGIARNISARRRSGARSVQDLPMDLFIALLCFAMVQLKPGSGGELR